MFTVKAFVPLPCGFISKGASSRCDLASRFLVPVTPLLFLSFSLRGHLCSSRFCHFSQRYLIENMERVCVFFQLLLVSLTSVSLASCYSPVKGKLLFFFRHRWSCTFRPNTLIVFHASSFMMKGIFSSPGYSFCALFGCMYPSKVNVLVKVRYEDEKRILTRAAFEKWVFLWLLCLYLLNTMQNLLKMQVIKCN